jgi:ribulose-phosphate 3-epimerase
MEKSSIKVAPSIFGADFGCLADEARRAVDAGADSLHVDIMDGHFAPNLTLGPRAVAALNRATDAFLDVHIMVYNPYSYIEKLVESGADQITFHLEATEDVADTLAYIRKCGVKAGLALSPETSPTLAINYLNQCDMILVMTVNPGFGGQEFMSEMLDKIRFLRETCDKLEIRDGGRVLSAEEKEKGISLPPFDIQVDGGINDVTGKQCVNAGANVLVAGSYVFTSNHIQEAIESLRS